MYVEALLFDRDFTIFLAKYFNYRDIFLAENIVKLLKHFGINDHIIKLE